MAKQKAGFNEIRLLPVSWGSQGVNVTVLVPSGNPADCVYLMVLLLLFFLLFLHHR